LLLRPRVSSQGTSAAARLAWALSIFQERSAHAVAFALRSEYIVRRAAELMIGNFYDEKKPHVRAAFFQ
jgi:hypothetical protein